MVRLNRITTRTGDDGTTGLADGSRVSKNDPRIAACGDIDELSCLIGGVIAAKDVGDVNTAWATALTRLLMQIQQDLFDLGAEIATPRGSGRNGPAIGSEHVTALESRLDAMNAELEPLNSFVLPGGSPVAASLHIARATCRRAERSCVALKDQDGAGTAVPYLNRLSDLLFVAARWVNHEMRRPEPLWVPGGGTANLAESQPSR